MKTRPSCQKAERGNQFSGPAMLVSGILESDKAESRNRESRNAMKVIGWLFLVAVLEFLMVVTLAVKMLAH